MRQLSERQRQLLRWVLARVGIDPAVALIRLDTATASRDERLLWAELIGSEFANSGLDRDSEPTTLGLELEDLLDVINGPNLDAADSRGAPPTIEA